MTKRYKLIDLFCGAGGLSRGFYEEGFEVILGIDNDEMALKTFQENHGNTVSMNLDLYKKDSLYKVKEEFFKHADSLDVLIGGPPCQGFSLAGKRDEEDERNKLYKAMVTLAEIMKPKVVVLENVPGMLTLYNGGAKNRIFNDFENIGYNMNVKILYAPEYGIPQIRKRAFFVGLLNEKEKFIFPKPILKEDEFITTEEAISDLPALVDIYGEEIQKYEVSPKSNYQKEMRANSKAIYNHIGTLHSEKTKKMIALVPEGKNHKALPKEYQGIYKYNEALTRYHSKKPSLTINTGHRSHFHYKYNRIPTVRESARLQSFTDDFIFYGNKTQQYKQVGNAVPPKLGSALAKQIKIYLQGKDNNE